MAARAVGIWGIDLGQCAFKAIRLEMKDGQSIATAFEYIEHPKILSQPDADPDELTREALNQFLSRNKIKGDIVCHQRARPKRFGPLRQAAPGR